MTIQDKRFNGSETETELPKMVRCTKCAKRYPATPEFFYRAKRGGLRRVCRSCWRIENAVTYANRTAARYGVVGIVTGQDYRNLLKQACRGLKRGFFRCGHTGRIVPIKYLSFDHATPLSQGGANLPENIVVCDVRVNSQKGVKTAKQFAHVLAARGVRNRYLPETALVQKRLIGF